MEKKRPPENFLPELIDPPKEKDERPAVYIDEQPTGYERYSSESNKPKPKNDSKKDPWDVDFSVE